MKIVDKLEMTDDKIRLIYSMLLSIQDNVNDLVNSFDINNPDWKNILNNLDESEAKIVYILNNAKDELKK